MRILLLRTVERPRECQLSPNIRETGIFAITIHVELGMTTLHLSVDRNVGVPIYRQVYEGLRRAILDGRLRPGQRIPSSRSLATDLGVSRLPVLSAYEQLLHEGYLIGRTGSGTFVSDAVPDDLLHPHPIASGLVSSRRVSRGAATRKAADRPATSRWNFPVVPFQGGLPALDLFPFATWAKLVARHVHADTPERIAYTDPAGLMALRAAIAEHLRSARAVRCEAEQVLIVPGSQAALRLTAAALLEPGDRVAIEEPGYFGVHRALRAAGAEVVPIPVDEEGFDVAALRRRGGPIRAVSRRRTSTRWG
jgi:GntR family transcriptional regulator/MocR family aminotransferase